MMRVRAYLSSLPAATLLAGCENLCEFIFQDNVSVDAVLFEFPSQISPVNASVPSIQLINPAGEPPPLLPGAYPLCVPFSAQTLARAIAFVTDTPVPVHSSLQDEISQALLELGMKPTLAGFSLCLRAVVRKIRRESLPMNQIYTAVAQETGHTPAAVERSMRTAIEFTWQHGSIDNIYRIFGNTTDPEKGKPTNACFVATLALYIRGSRSRQRRYGA